MESGDNLSILNHDVLFHLGGKTLNIADSGTQKAITEYVLESGAGLPLGCWENQNTHAPRLWEPYWNVRAPREI